MSPRVIQLPMSGRDVKELHKAEQAHASLVRRIREAYRIADEHLRLAHQLACEEWNTRRFIGGDASPTIADAN